MNAPDLYELRECAGGFELSGGRLGAEKWMFETRDADEPIRTVGFISLLNGGELRVYDEAGELRATRTFAPAAHSSFEDA